MAYVGGASPLEEDPNKPQQGQGPNEPQAPIATSSAPGAGPGPAPAAGATGATPSNQAAPQPFTNLQTYLTANAPQIEGMGQKVANQIGEQYGKLQGDIGASTQGFQQRIAGGYTAPNADIVSRATTNPVEFASNPENVAAFQKQLTNQYTGPTNFESSDYYANLNRDIQGAATKANQVSTPEGLRSYLLGMGQNPTPGDTMLDQVLLSGSPAAYSNVKQAASQVQGLPDYLSGLIPEQNKAVQDAIAAANTSRQGAETGLTTAGTSFADRLAKQTAAAQGDYTNYNTSVGKLRSTAQDINSQIQAYLAANPNMKVSGGNDYLAPWVNLSEATIAPTMQNVAGQEDYATQAALAKLAGDSGLLNLPLDQSTASQAGTFNLPLDLQAAIANKDIPAAMTKTLESLSGQITGAYAPLQRAEEMAYAKGTLPGELSAAKKAYDAAVKGGRRQDGTIDPAWQPRVDQAKSAYDAAQQKMNEAVQKFGPAESWVGWESVAPAAQGLQWLGPASTGYNDLVAQLQADLQGLSTLNVPEAKAPGLPGKTPEQQTGSAVGTAVGAGTGAASLIPGTAMMSGAEIAAGSPAALDAAGLSASQTLGPAALAAYGASNIAQNVAANPVRDSLATLANTGISLATLSLPPKILDQLGNKLQGVLDSIGDFFGGLF